MTNDKNIELFYISIIEIDLLVKVIVNAIISKGIICLLFIIVLAFFNILIYKIYEII